MTAFSTASALQNQMNQLMSDIAAQKAQIAAYQNQLQSQYSQAQQQMAPVMAMGGSGNGAAGGGGGGGIYAYPGSVGSAGIVSPSIAAPENKEPAKPTALVGLLEDLL